MWCNYECQYFLDFLFILTNLTYSWRLLSFYFTPCITYIILDVYVLVANYASEWDSPYLYWWLVSSCVNSLYTYAWDIKMDWGLLDKHPGENTFLREEVVYSSLVSHTTFYILTRGPVLPSWTSLAGQKSNHFPKALHFSPCSEIMKN